LGCKTPCETEFHLILERNYWHRSDSVVLLINLIEQLGQVHDFYWQIALFDSSFKLQHAAGIRGDDDFCACLFDEIKFSIENGKTQLGIEKIVDTCRTATVLTFD